MSYNSKNYSQQGGEKTVIGGEIEILAGGTIKVNPGAIVDGLLQILSSATTTKIGGVKKAVAQADSVASDVAGLVTDFNALLAKLRTAGILSAS